jgi:hypothetical protein
MSLNQIDLIPYF